MSSYKFESGAPSFGKTGTRRLICWLASLLLKGGVNTRRHRRPMKFLWAEDIGIHNGNSALSQIDIDPTSAISPSHRSAPPWLGRTCFQVGWASFVKEGEYRNHPAAPHYWERERERKYRVYIYSWCAWMVNVNFKISITNSLGFLFIHGRG